MFGVKMNQCLLAHELWTFLCVYTVQEEKRRGRGRTRFVQKLREFVGCDPIANAICVKGQKSLDTGSHTYIHTYAYTKNKTGYTGIQCGLGVEPHVFMCTCRAGVELN